MLSIFLGLALLFEIVHAWEEYHFTYRSARKGAGLTGINLGKKLPDRSKEESGLIVYKIMMVVMMLLLTLITAGGAPRLIALIIFGFIFHISASPYTRLDGDAHIQFWACYCATLDASSYPVVD